MVLHLRFKHIFFITFLFTITNCVVYAKNLDFLSQTNISENHLTNTTAVFVSSASINQFLFQSAKSKDTPHKNYLLPISLIFFIKPNKVVLNKESLNLALELKYSKKSARAPPIANNKFEFI